MLSKHYQISLIKYMFENEDFFIKCVSYLEPSYFSNDKNKDQYLFWIYKQLKDYYKKYNEKPALIWLGQKICSDINEDKREAYLSVMLKIKEKKVTEIKYLQDELTTFIKTSEFKKMHKKAAEVFNDGLYSEAFTITEQAMEKINTVQFAEDDYVKINEIDQILVEARESHNNEINIMGKSFFIDKYRQWSGMIPKKSVTTIISAYNVGKTSASISCCYHAAMSGKKILFIFHEGRKEQIVLKFISRITKIPYNSLKSGGYLEEPDQIQKIEKAKKMIDKYIRIKEMRHVGVTVEDVFKYCKNMKRNWDFDMMVDDYGQKLFSKKKMEFRHNLAHTWNTFDLMSAELDIAILTCAQLNRDNAIKNKAGEKIVRSDGVSEAITIAHVSETILTLNKSSKQENDNQMVICLDKARDAQAGLLIECQTDMRCALTHDPKWGMEAKGYDGQMESDSDE